MNAHQPEKDTEESVSMPSLLGGVKIVAPKHHKVKKVDIISEKDMNRIIKILKKVANSYPIGGLMKPKELALTTNEFAAVHILSDQIAREQINGFGNRLWLMYGVAMMNAGFSPEDIDKVFDNLKDSREEYEKYREIFWESGNPDDKVADMEYCNRLQDYGVKHAYITEGAL